MTKFGAIPLAAAMAAVSLQAGAWTIFGSREDALADRLRAGDKFMLKADEALKDGDPSLAGRYYDRAIRKYEALNAAEPGYMDGIAAIRIEYCARQYTNSLAAAESQKSEVEGQKSEVEGQKPEVEVPEVGSQKSEVASAAVPAPAAEPAPAATEAKAESPAPAAMAEPSAPRHSAPSTNAVAEAEAEAPAPPAKPVYDARNFKHDFAEARTMVEDGNLSEAARILIPMLRHDPANRQVRLLIAIVRTRQGRCDEAIVALEDLRGIREDLPVLLALAGAYTGASRYHDALLALDSAVKLNPADPNAYLNLAWLTIVMPTEADTLRNAEIYYRQAIRRGAPRDRTLEARIGLAKW